jgi:hypothetical protein
MRLFSSTKAVILPIIIGTILYSCHASNDSGKTTNTKDTVSKFSQETKKPQVIKQHVLLSNIKTHIFSDHSNKDTFKLVLTGDSLYTATAIFSIISHKGVRIYADTFHGSDLFNNDDTVPPSIAKIDDTIKERVRTFFENMEFVDTAASMGGDGNDNTDTVFMQEIEADKTIIGFHYFIGYEDDQYIAYSKKQHKVLVYWSCC